MDVGVAANFNERWSASLALSNLFGSVSWTPDETSRGFLLGDSLTVYNISDDEDDAITDSIWTYEGGDGFSRKLPLVLRLGGAYKKDYLTFTADYVQSFSQHALVNKKPQFALGIEWQSLSWLPLRAGLVTGGKLGFGTCFGFGIRPGGFILDIGVMNGGFIVPNNAKGLVLAVDLGMVLP
jgi:hypothetical protein